jgi:hypothetical protein
VTSRWVAVAKAFFHAAIKRRGSAPRTITLDGYVASHRAVREMKKRRSTASGHEGAFVEVSEPPDRTRSPWREISHRPHARIQVAQNSGDQHRRHRAVASHSQAPVQARCVSPQRQNHAHRVERGVGRVTKRAPPEASRDPDLNCTLTRDIGHNSTRTASFRIRTVLSGLAFATRIDPVAPVLFFLSSGPLSGLER